MELKTLSSVIVQSVAIALFIGLLYMIQVCLRSSRDLEHRNQVRIDVAHKIRSGAFRQSVEYLYSIERVLESQRMSAEFQEPEDVENRLPFETEWKCHPELRNTQVQNWSGGSSRIAG